ncbi:MAG TPA: UDP-N-acetylmuramoyl-L-alanyl-D-glutamate--2,6-diaminopimelate ligase, partial [Kiloniellales bacterium]|nr:UDP-N-acetylmuramoyl-L-alanyl-D-glutamate--2,6-diaminopimelate ligase [Kiloniellales bacterium]
MPSATAQQDCEILGLSADSRAVGSGYLFAALPGSRADGRDYIDQAVARGAVAVLAPSGTRLADYGRPVTLVTDDNPRRRLALMAARFYGAQPEVIAAVTGTNGKTSIVSFTRQIWQALGYRAASLGTLGLMPERPDAPKSLTTPDPVDLQRCLAELARDGFDHLAMEASSHGLDQYRLDGVRVGLAAFTNLTRDHLDYHGSMADYRAAKLRLFRELLDPDGTAVLNADEPESAGVAEVCRARGIRVLDYGADARDLRLVAQEPKADGQDLELEFLGRKHGLFLPLAGTFQAGNALAALGLAIAGGAEPDAALAVLGRLEGVTGRIEAVVETPSGGRVYVDYAHTPGALETVLAALRPHARGELWVVFGCGGDRDRGKRPMMGEIAGRLADRVIVTDDNPRSEDPAAIRREILA